jgi:hypothetical protein
MLSMTRIALIEKSPPPAKPEKVPKMRRYALVRLPSKYDYLREAHD